MTPPYYRAMPGPSFCPACRELRRRACAYLCGPCWIRLPSGTQAALWARDGQVVPRFLALLRALKEGRPLEEIEV
jgi:hypothetical protein